ncbi:YcgN family cysteine cluster protein [Mameliella sediminis]|uniref:YcgN family cysteine cluster protein n=1 Tax=Mameliella sediminis TaxID=2836866 RepID=UPI001C44AC54|nr:YcgN family cysteine cluster protein [Mameliella sediminis]MBY6113074.1 YcgN family cysteine cluster protein [Antarctobacter heliothermus]MBY6143578.1 YcgN family cysteine cluster protein [Mameliella alba]MBV7394357.1 YcgN family cysteine cluster protein [Mameliella sediminis]MBY6162658.1 YcgN family cysteine cluster protein [Mameliella alba]MBY6172317.1 YcgN family cysteine cluster protein [Mameliella alba]
MSDPIERAGLMPRFWEKKRLRDMTEAEWEALCDGCGKCCLNKLEDEDTGEVALTRVACRLFDDSTCRCAQYQIRHQFVPECIVLRPANIEKNLYWMPETCAYKLLWNGEPLFDWHPLISGTAETVHAAGVSMQGATVPEFEVDEDDWEDHIIEEPR